MAVELYKGVFELEWGLNRVNERCWSVTEKRAPQSAKTPSNASVNGTPRPHDIDLNYRIESAQNATPLTKARHPLHKTQRAAR